MADKIIIEVRINEYAMRNANPHIPYSPDEIATQALDCWREGASIIHYHARDPQTGAPSSDAKLYAETVRRIKAQSDRLCYGSKICMAVTMPPSIYWPFWRGGASRRGSW